MARFCAFLRVFFFAFLCISVLFFLPKWPAEKRNFAHNRAKMCKKRFYAIPPLVIPPFACHRFTGVSGPSGPEFSPKKSKERSFRGRPKSSREFSKTSKNTYRERKKHIKKKTRKQNFHGIVPGFLGGILFMCFFLPLRNDPKKTHKQNFGTHPIPGQSRKFVYVYVFFLSPNLGVVLWGTGGILFREYCFGEENSLSSAANSVSSARNSVSSRVCTQIIGRKELTEFGPRNSVSPKKTHCSPCAPAEARRWNFFDFSQGNLENVVGNLEGILRDFFLTHRTEAQNFRGKFRSIFRKKIRSFKKIFRAKFTLQTCRLNSLSSVFEAVLSETVFGPSPILSNRKF